ncbi:uncharacterized protein [Spinacia oleracea]|uniref:Reverse transcriptase domain-containing protein n=1 Tax=Spinacia oleracea TaxID=3562 RepID=A0ABM3QYL4_SPIOL|nr:uncharacterized protein LOC130463380 [Spinacia oleracea]
MLGELGFPSRFIGWIMQCLQTVSYSILINGMPTTPIPAKKGLRQGDSLSPYLCAIGMEYLSRCLTSLNTDTTFRYHLRCKKVDLTHMMFADDLLLFARGDSESVDAIFKAFRTLVNYTECKPLIEKIVARIKCWSARLLSYDGRLQLIKSVLFGIQLYWCQIFVLPKKVMKEIQRICRCFLLTGSEAGSKKAHVSWEQLCLPKSSGGWNLKDLTIWNKAAFLKNFWALSLKQDRLWVKWIHTYYIKNNNFWSMPIPNKDLSRVSESKG